jgi:hypothetical protein
MNVLKHNRLHEMKFIIRVITEDQTFTVYLCSLNPLSPFIEYCLLLVNPLNVIRTCVSDVDIQNAFSLDFI